MEIRLRSILLVTALALATLPVAEVAAQSEEAGEGSLIEPQIERVEFDESLIDSYDIELAFYGGLLAIQDFDTNLVTGFKVGYHVSEDFFVQGSFARSEVGETSYERLGGAPLLSNKEREVEYYLVSLGFNLFPGEAFVTDSTTFNTVFYVSGGVGNTRFAGDDRFTMAYAVGHRTIFADGFSLDFEMRDLIFEMDIFGSEDTTNNLEFTISLNLFL